jgi:hypothetical protein
MQLLIKGGKPLELSDIEVCVRGKLKGKETELFRSIQGFFTDHHRFVLKTILATITMLEAQIMELDGQIGSVMAEHSPLLERMKKAPGISDVSACDILAEIGPTLESFSTDTALVSWCGLCPGNNESAGKRKSGKSPVRKHHLKTIRGLQNIKIPFIMSSNFKSIGDEYEAIYFESKWHIITSNKFDRAFD